MAKIPELFENGLAVRTEVLVPLHGGFDRLVVCGS